jgi:hypothetical protein
MKPRTDAIGPQGRSDAPSGLGLLLAFLLALLGTPGSGARAFAEDSKPKLTVVELLQKASERAKEEKEKPPHREFYRTKLTLDLDKKQNVKKREELKYWMKLIDGALYPFLLEKNGQALTPEERKQEEEKEAAFRNKSEAKEEKKKSNSILAKINDETASRFDYQISGREVLKGRPACLITISPKPGLKSKTIEEQVMARLAGKVWIDEGDYSVARLEVRLLQPVQFGLGILGSVSEFELKIDRTWLGEKDWENSKVSAWVQFRILFDPTRIRYEETISAIP